MVDAALAMRFGAMQVSGDPVLDTDSLLVDRRFGIESSMLLQEYYPRTLARSPSDEDEQPATPDPPGFRPVPRPRFVRAQSANPATRARPETRVHDVSVQSLVPFGSNQDQIPSRRRLDEVKSPVYRKTPRPMSQPPDLFKTRPKSSGPTRQRLDEVVWSSSKRISTLDERRQDRIRVRQPNVPDEEELTPETKETRRGVVLHVVHQLHTDMNVSVPAPPSVLVVETPRNAPTQTSTPSRSSSLRAGNPFMMTKDLADRRHELQKRIHTHPSTVKKPTTEPVKNVLLKMYCVLDEYEQGGRDGPRYVKRFKKKPEIPMQKKVIVRLRRGATQAVSTEPHQDRGGNLTPTR
ncbi:unnamed protein product [Aphanomyces euteiches]|nr:hypothetical protein AeRB84_001852 [Aphanomyces euteiches]